MWRGSAGMSVSKRLKPLGRGSQSLLSSIVAAATARPCSSCDDMTTTTTTTTISRLLFSSTPTPLPVSSLSFPFDHRSYCSSRIEQQHSEHVIDYRLEGMDHFDHPPPPAAVEKEGEEEIVAAAASEEGARELDAKKLEDLLSLLLRPTPREDEESFESTLDTIFKASNHLGEPLLLQLLQTPPLLPHNFIAFFNWAINKKKEKNLNLDVGLTPRVLDALVRSIANKETAPALWALLQQIALHFDVLPNEVHTFNRLILLFSQLGSEDHLFEVFTKIGDFGYVPNSESYYLTIAGLCKASSFGKAWAVCERMLHVGALPDSAGKLGDIIRWFCKASKTKEAHLVYMRAKEKAKYPPFSDLNKLIGSLSRKDETVRLAAQVLDGLSGKDRKMAIKPFSLVVRDLCRMKDVGGAKELLSKMIAKGPPPGNDIFNRVVAGYSKNGYMKEAINTMKLMESRGLKPDVYTYTVVMSGYTRAGLMEEAYEILSQAKEKHSKLTPVTYHTLIRGYCKLEQFDKALELLAEMKEFGVQPNVDEYNKLVQSLCLKAIDWEAAAKLLKEMEDNGLHLNGITKGLIRAVKELEEEEGPNKVASIAA